MRNNSWRTRGKRDDPREKIEELTYQKRLKRTFEKKKNNRDYTHIYICFFLNMRLRQFKKISFSITV